MPQLSPWDRSVSLGRRSVPRGKRSREHGQGSGFCGARWGVQDWNLGGKKTPQWLPQTRFDEVRSQARKGWWASGAKIGGLGDSLERTAGTLSDHGASQDSSDSFCWACSHLPPAFAPAPNRNFAVAPQRVVVTFQGSIGQLPPPRYCSGSSTQSVS